MQLGNQQQLCQFYIGYSIPMSWRLNADAGKKTYCSISMQIISSIEWWWTSVASCGKSLKPPQTYCKLVIYIYIYIGFYPPFHTGWGPTFQKKNIETIDSVNTRAWVKTKPVGPKNQIGDLYSQKWSSYNRIAELCLGPMLHHNALSEGRPWPNQCAP